MGSRRFQRKSGPWGLSQTERSWPHTKMTIDRLEWASELIQIPLVCVIVAFIVFFILRAIALSLWKDNVQCCPSNY